MTPQQIDNIDIHSRRAWGLTSMLMTYVNQNNEKPNKEVINEALSEIFERLDAIGYKMTKGVAQ